MIPSARRRPAMVLAGLLALLAPPRCHAMPVAVVVDLESRVPPSDLLGGRFSALGGRILAGATGTGLPSEALEMFDARNDPGFAAAAEIARALANQGFDGPVPEAADGEPVRLTLDIGIGDADPWPQAALYNGGRVFTSVVPGTGTVPLPATVPLPSARANPYTSTSAKGPRRRVVQRAKGERRENQSRQYPAWPAPP